MKKTAIFLVLIISMLSINAQQSKVVSAYNYIKPQYNELGKAKEAIDEASKHEKTIGKAKTWYYRGQVYHAIYQSTDTNFQDLHETPLTEAVNAYIKAIELDEKEQYKKDCIGRLKIASVQLLNKGINDFNANDYSKALDDFENSIRINSLEYINEIDSMAIFNAAIAADRNKNYDKAIKYYNETIDLKYEGSKVFLFLSNVLKTQGDTIASIEKIKDGIDAYPDDNNSLIIELINYYLATNKSEEALGYLKIAIEKDSLNHSFHFAEGTIYDRMEEYDKAIKCYAAAIELEEDFFDAQYNIGAVYYNRAVQHFNVANDIPQNKQKEYEDEIVKAKEQMKSALPYLEKAHELNEKDLSTMQSLKEIYVRLQMYDKSKEIKAKMDAAKE
ncbi:MAG: tetratricopeptide repeat protein [Bacteroidales bacterium]|nr:tetratricopeptide repeat protein [Bacteroidales bacterium]